MLTEVGAASLVVVASMWTILGGDMFPPAPDPTGSMLMSNKFEDPG